MNEYSVGLTVIRRAVVAIGAVCANLLVPRKLDFLAVARNPERIVNLAKEIAGFNADEILVSIPGLRATDLSNTADVPAQYLSQGIPSPFGDW